MSRDVSIRNRVHPVRARQGAITSTVNPTIASTTRTACQPAHRSRTSAQFGGGNWAFQVRISVFSGPCTARVIPMLATTVAAAVAAATLMFRSRRPRTSTVTAASRTAGYVAASEERDVDQLTAIVDER